MTAPRWPAGLSLPGDETTLDAAPAPRPGVQAPRSGHDPSRPPPTAPRAEAAPEPGSYRPPAEDPAAHRLATFSRGDGEELRVELAEYEGRPFVSLRLWFRGSLGAWHPTRKGVSLRLVELPKVVEALGDAEVQLAGGRRYSKPRRSP